MKLTKTLLTVAIAAAASLTSMVPRANAAVGDSAIFKMVKSAGAKGCREEEARGRVTISDLGAVQGEVGFPRRTWEDYQVSFTDEEIGLINLWRRMPTFRTLEHDRINC